MIDVKNRAVIIERKDFNEVEFMLWLFDIGLIKRFKDVEFGITGTNRVRDFDVIYFRCSDEKYNTIYTKMDSLGLWRGDCENPRFTGETLYIDKANVLIKNMANRYLIIGV